MVIASKLDSRRAEGFRNSTIGGAANKSADLPRARSLRTPELEVQTLQK
jgi:hypothetical protein